MFWKDPIGEWGAEVLGGKGKFWAEGPPPSGCGPAPATRFGGALRPKLGAGVMKVQ